jgi:putative nucleotidyltransferase-like protein
MRRKRASIADLSSERQDEMVNRKSVGELLLDVLRPGGDAGRVDCVRGLLDCEWDDVVRESVRQGVAPLLYGRLRNGAGRTRMPARASRMLRELAVNSTFKSLGLYSELGVVLGALRSNGIEVIVLKGAHLASVVYGDRAARPMRDVDLLVRKSDLGLAEATLFDLGYSRHPEKDADYSRCQHLQPVVRPGGLPIEIHWTIVSPTEPIDIDLDGLWERAHLVRIADVDVKVLSPEDLLLHLCVHTAFQHQFELGLRACWDILEVSRFFGDRIDWGQLESRARQWGVEKYVYLTLRLATELVGAVIPGWVLTALEPVGFESELMAVAKKEVLTGQAAASVSPRFAEIWGTGRLRKKVGVVLETLFPSRWAMRRMYPASGNRKWVWVFYVLRWRDLLRKYGRSFWAVVSGDERTKSLVRWEHERARLMDWLKAVRA